MADKTEISWTDHTFNPWWGCTAIAPGCDNCYAAALDKRTGGDYWNPKVAPRRTRVQNWNKVHKWNEQAKTENRRHRVFCGSMMDWCDNNAPEGIYEALWQLISDTPYLDWQMLTKRGDRIEKLLPTDWYEGYDNVWLGVTVEDRTYGYPRLDALREIPAKVRFLSCEPLLEDVSDINLDGIDWVIIGGESGPNYRPMKESWAKGLLARCEYYDVPVWFKQWGGNKKPKGGCIIGGNERKEWPKCG